MQAPATIRSSGPVLFSRLPRPGDRSYRRLPAFAVSPHSIWSSSILPIPTPSDRHQPDRERWIYLGQFLSLAVRLHPHLQLCRTSPTRGAHGAQFLVGPFLPALSGVCLQPLVISRHADAGGAGPHQAGFWPGSDSHPVAAAGMASGADHVLEHARLDHVHRGVLLSFVPVADHPPPSPPDADNFADFVCRMALRAGASVALHAFQSGW